MEKEKKTAIDAPRGTVFKLYPEELTLVTDKNHPLFDERVNLPPDEGMVKNIMWRGVMEPISVRKNGVDLEVVYGRQRVKAALEANKRLLEQGKELIRVKCEIVHGEDKDLFGMLVSENELRQDDAPMAKAKKAQRMIDLGASEEEVCLAFHISRQALRNWQSMLDLSAPIKKAVDKGEITATAALELGKLPAEEQSAKLDELKASGERITTKRAKRAAKGDAEPVQRVKTRKEIEEVLERGDNLFENKDYNQGYIAALRWVLGQDEK